MRVDSRAFSTTVRSLTHERSRKLDLKQLWRLRQIPIVFKGKVPKQEWKITQCISPKGALMGRAGVTQKLIWRLLGQERREVPRSKLAPTRPGQEYMRRETPSCLSGSSRKTFNLFSEPSVNHEPQSLYLRISSDASRHGFPDTAHMLCGGRFRGTRRLACCLEGQNLVMNSIFFSFNFILPKSIRCIPHKSIQPHTMCGPLAM